MNGYLCASILWSLDIIICSAYKPTIMKWCIMSYTPYKQHDLSTNKIKLLSYMANIKKIASLCLHQEISWITKCQTITCILPKSKIHGIMTKVPNQSPQKNTQFTSKAPLCWHWWSPQAQSLRPFWVDTGGVLRHKVQGPFLLTLVETSGIKSKDLLDWHWWSPLA